MSEAEGRLDPAGMDRREFSRRNFVKTAAWAGAALSAAGIGGVGFATKFAGAQNGGQPAYTTYQGLGDVAILQFAYQLELLEGTFYDMGINSGLFSGNQFATAQIAAIRDAEMAHADALASGLQEAGASVPATPNFTFPDGTFTDQGAFLELAATFEPVGIGAYQGAAPVVQNKEYLALAGSIHNAEGRHRVAINILLGVDPPNNNAFGEALPLGQVQEAVAPFGIG
jgi:hypothetical protein